MSHRSNVGFGMRVWGPEWSATSRHNHTRFILRKLNLHDCAEFGVPGHGLGFFIEVEGSLTSNPGSGKMRNAFYPKHSQAFCSFVIRREEADLEGHEFKQMLAQKFVDAAVYFSPFFKKKRPEFDDVAYISCIRAIMDDYLTADISELPDEETVRVLAILNERRRQRGEELGCGQIHTISDSL